MDFVDHVCKESSSESRWGSWIVMIVDAWVGGYCSITPLKVFIVEGKHEVHLGQDGVANLKNRVRVRLFSRCRDALWYYFFDKASTQPLKITSLQDQTGRKPGIGPFAYLGPKHFPRSGYVEVLLGDWPMVKPEPNQRQSDWEFHAMENYVSWLQIDFEESWLRREKTFRILMFGEVRQDFYPPGLWMGSDLEIIWNDLQKELT